MADKRHNLVIIWSKSSKYKNRWEWLERNRPNPSDAWVDGSVVKRLPTTKGSATGSGQSVFEDPHSEKLLGKVGAPRTLGKRAFGNISSG